MKELNVFYRRAEKENIVVDHFELHTREAISLMDGDGQCYIAIDPTKIVSEADERTKLAHELGHCVTGAFYNQYSNFDCRQRHENRADKWAILETVPIDDLDAAVASGCSTIWDLAGYFGVTEAFMRKALCWYTHGNLAADLYF